MVSQSYFAAVGRRKEAVARVRLLPGPGDLVVNGKPLEEAFPVLRHRNIILQPFKVTGTEGQFSATVKVEGGGTGGWAGAIRHGIARALVESDVALRPPLKKAGLLTRDPRVKERKKYGLKRARKAKQYTKR